MLSIHYLFLYSKVVTKSVETVVFFDVSALRVLLDCFTTVLSMILEFSIKFWVYSEKLAGFFVVFLW